MLAYRVAGTWRATCARSKIYIPLLDLITEKLYPVNSRISYHEFFFRSCLHVYSTILSPMTRSVMPRTLQNAQIMQLVLPMRHAASFSVPCRSCGT